MTDGDGEARSVEPSLVNIVMLYLDGGSLDLVDGTNQGETTWTQLGSEPLLEIFRIVTCGAGEMVLTVALTTA